MNNPARWQRQPTRWIGLFLGFGCVMLSAHGVAQTNYSGQWEYQALNAGDTSFKVEHKGESITFYRVLYPQYQGQRYKLEHIYRGTLSGENIAGEMWVREEGVDEFERLRLFSGKIESTQQMTMDDMPLKRVESHAKNEAETKTTLRALPDTSTADLSVEQKPTAVPKVNKKPHLADKVQQDQPPGSRLAAASAPPIIPQLTMVNRNLPSSRTRQAEKLLSQGDQFYAKKDYQKAVKRYQKALRLDSKRVELYYKLGLGHGILGSSAAKQKSLPQARQHLEMAIGFWQQAVRLDPYNRGAKENIKRAQTKLRSLGR